VEEGVEKVGTTKEIERERKKKGSNSYCPLGIVNIFSGVGRCGILLLRERKRKWLFPYV
jgi:hypothetical protein